MTSCRSCASIPSDTPRDCRTAQCVAVEVGFLLRSITRDPHEHATGRRRHRRRRPGRAGPELLPDRAGPRRTSCSSRDASPRAGAASGGTRCAWSRPNWTLRLPGFAYAGDDPDGFMGKDEVVAHLETYARSFAAPVREGVRVTAIERDPADTALSGADRGRLLHGSPGGACHRRAAAAARSGVRGGPARQRDAGRAPAYRNPQPLPPGAVLVVGSGETGCQIAEELVRAGRTVFLAGGRSWWAPRRYRGRDICGLAARRWAGSSAPSTSSRLGSALGNPTRN